MVVVVELVVVVEERGSSPVGGWVDKSVVEGFFRSIFCVTNFFCKQNP